MQDAPAVSDVVCEAHQQLPVASHLTLSYIVSGASQLPTVAATDDSCVWKLPAWKFTVEDTIPVGQPSLLQPCLSCMAGNTHVPPCPPCIGCICKRKMARVHACSKACGTQFGRGGFVVGPGPTCLGIMGHNAYA